MRKKATDEALKQRLENLQELSSNTVLEMDF
jgi:hypothetical protein